MAETWLNYGKAMETAPSHNVFSTVPTTNYLGLFGKGAPDPKKTAKFLDFTKDEISSATGVARESVRFDNRIPAELRDRLMEIAIICELVAEHFNGDIPKTALWFKVSNPLLGNLSPRDQIRLGRYRKILRFLQAAREAAAPPTRR